MPRHERPTAPAAPIERIRNHLVSLRMPRALEALDQVVQQLERGQPAAIEAIETLLAEETHHPRKPPDQGGAADGASDPDQDAVRVRLLVPAIARAQPDHGAGRARLHRSP